MRNEVTKKMLKDTHISYLLFFLHMCQNKMSALGLRLSPDLDLCHHMTLTRATHSVVSACIMSASLSEEQQSDWSMKPHLRHLHRDNIGGHRIQPIASHRLIYFKSTSNICRFFIITMTTPFHHLVIGLGLFSITFKCIVGWDYFFPMS